jgi:hypothetical protein
VGEVLYENPDGLTLSRFAGPVGPDGTNQPRWQLTTPLPMGYVVLDRRELKRLFDVMMGQLAISHPRNLEEAAE